MAASYDELLQPIRRLFGGVVMHENRSEDPAIGRHGGMVWLGDNSIEIGAPLGDRSPVRGFVDRLGGGMHSIALRVRDVDEMRVMRSRLHEHGVRPVANLGDEVLFTHPSDTAGLLLEWSCHRTADDPRWGHSLPPSAVEPIAPVRQYGFVTAVVSDPGAAAQRLATLLGTDVVRLTPGAGPDQIGAIVSLVDCLLVLFALPADEAFWPWGQRPRRPRFWGHGLVVDDLRSSLRALAEVGVAAAGTLGRSVFLDPSALPVPTFLCEDLLPEDPRR